MSENNMAVDPMRVHIDIVGGTENDAHQMAMVLANAMDHFQIKNYSITNTEMDVEELMSGITNAHLSTMSENVQNARVEIELKGINTASTEAGETSFSIAPYLIGVADENARKFAADIIDTALIKAGVNMQELILSLRSDDRGLTEEQLKEKYSEDGAGGHPEFPRVLWRKAVDAQLTDIGYWPWVVMMIARA